MKNILSILALSFILLSGTMVSGYNFPAASAQVSESVDVESPVFFPVSDVFEEATSGLGAAVLYEIPKAVDNVAVVDTVCSPGPGDIFSLGVSIVSCIASDAAGNAAQIAFNVIVVDSTPPVITPQSDITVTATSSQTNVLVDKPQVFDLVDPFPEITQNIPESFPIGNTLITWIATDFAGNVATAIQKVTVSVLPPKISVSDITIEATSEMTPTAEIDFGAKIIDDLSGDTQLSSNVPEALPLGESLITWAALDFAGNTVTTTQRVMVTDTMPPKVEGVLEPIKVEDDEGTFTVLYNALDAVDKSPVITATINGISVPHGQLIKVELDDSPEVEIERGIIKFEGPHFELTVTATDFSGNVATTTVPVSFVPKEMRCPAGLIESEELCILPLILPEQELTIDELDDFIDELDDIDPLIFESMGDEIAIFSKISQKLFEQEDIALDKIRAEFKEKLKTADPVEKNNLQDELKKSIKEAKEDFRDMREDWSKIFKEYREEAKEVIKDKKDLEKKQIEEELFRIKSVFEKELEKVEIQEQKERLANKELQEKRAEEITRRMIHQLEILDSDVIAKKFLVKISEFKSDEKIIKQKMKNLLESIDDEHNVLDDEISGIENEILLRQQEILLKLTEKESATFEKQKEIEDEIEKLEGELEDRQKDIAKKREKIDEIEEKTREELGKLGDEFEKLEREFEEKRIEIEEKSQTGLSESEVNELREKFEEEFEEKRSEIAEKEKKIRQIEEDKLDEELSKLEKELAVLDVELIKKRADIAEKIAKAISEEELEEELEELEEEFEEKRSEIAEKEKKIRQIEEDDLEEEFEEKRSKLESKLQSNTQKEQKEFEEKLLQLDDEFEQKQSKITELVQSSILRKEIREKIEKDSEHIKESLRTKEIALQKKIFELEQKKASLDDIKDVKESLEKEQKELEKEQKEIEEQIKEERKRIEEEIKQEEKRLEEEQKELEEEQKKEAEREKKTIEKQQKALEKEAKEAEESVKAQQKAQEEEEKAREERQKEAEEQAKKDAEEAEKAEEEAKKAAEEAAKEAAENDGDD